MYYLIQISGCFYIVPSIESGDAVYCKGTQEECINTLDFIESGYIVAVPMA